MRWLAIACCIVFSALGTALAAVDNTYNAQARIEQISLERNFGYVVGDRVVVKATVALNQAEAIVKDEAQLPDWLELRRVNHRQVGRYWYLEWIYQVFYAPQHVSELQIPPRRVHFSQTTVEIPPLSFLISPVSRPVDALENNYAMPKPSTKPIQVSGAIVVLVMGLTIVEYYISRRKPRVFADAYAQLRRLVDSRDALLVMHQAIRRKIGRVALDTQDVISSWPAARRAESELDAFYHASRLLFFDESYVDGKSVAVRLCQKLREIDEA